MTREVEARLKISAVDKTGRVLQQVGNRLQQVNRQAAAFNAQQGMLGRTTASTMAVMGRFLAPAAVAAFTAGAVKDFAAVERQMTRIGITADASAAETEAAFRKMQSVSKDMALPLESALSAIDTLVSSGLTLKEAMDFLPSVLATAQASGSATEDIANTAIKASSALKIQATDMQRAFDIMVMGGKAGQFELKDMATYIPELANSFASLGYSGQDGLRTLIALLQTIREDTGSASGAATQAQNIFGKMYTSDTAKKFSSFGINLRKEMEAARKNGEDAVAAFVRLSKEALKGDLSKLPLLFTDQEFRLGMQSLITSADSYKRFVDAVNSSEVDGTVLRDLRRVTDDTQASIDKMSASWDKLTKSFGGKLANPAAAAMDFVTDETSYQDAVDRALEARGMGYLDKEFWKFQNMNGAGGARGNETKASDLMALEGDYGDPAIRARWAQGPHLPDGWKPEQEFPGGAKWSEGDAGPIPTWRPAQDLSDLGKSTKTIATPEGRPAYISTTGRDAVTSAMLARRSEIAYLNERGRDYEHPSAPEEFTGDATSYKPWRPRKVYGDSVVDKSYPRLEKSTVEGMRDGDRRSYTERHAGMEPWTPTRAWDAVKDMFSPEDAQPVGEALAAAAISRMSSDASSVGNEMASVVRDALAAIAPQIGSAIAASFAAQASQVKIGVNMPAGGVAGGSKVKANTGISMPELAGSNGGGGH